MLNAVVFEWLELLTRRALLSFYPRFSMRLAFERWHMRVAIRRKEESLKRGHVKLQIELDEVRGQRAALADTSAELQRAQLQLTTQAAEHARELERVRQSRYVCAPQLRLPATPLSEAQTCSLPTACSRFLPLALLHFIGLMKSQRLRSRSK